MSLRRVLGWIWAIVGRVLLYGTACLVIAFLFVRQEDRKSTRLNSSHSQQSRMPSSA